MRRVLAVPRWEKGKRVGSNISCFVHNCTERSFAQSSMCVSKELKSMLSLQFRSESLPNPTPLCKSHYHAVYDVHQSQEKNCRTCGKRLRVGNDRPCPQPHVMPCPQPHVMLYRNTIILEIFGVNIFVGPPTDEIK